MTERPSITVDTPFGAMRAIFLGNGQISLRDLAQTEWNPVTKAHECGEPIQINRVEYRASFTGQKAPSGEWVENYASIDRVGSVKAFDYSSAALRKFRETMPGVCADLANKHADLLRAAEIARLTDEFANAERNCERIMGELSQARADLARLREELTDAQVSAGIHDSEQMQYRYLTRAELEQIAKQVYTPGFARYLTCYPHPIGNGACLKVALSVGQARELDPIADALLSGQLTAL
jgi:hypothetical protein